MQLDRSAYTLTVNETFDADSLNEQLWVPHYLPQWTTPQRSLARFDIVDSTLRLKIESDQLAWSPEFSDGFRVSNLQTGVRAAAEGDTHGQHRHQSGLEVRTAGAESRRLLTPTYGLIEARVRANPDPRTMVALWLIGFEDSPEDSGELCVFEIFGSEVSQDQSLVGVGIKPHHDPRLADSFTKVPVSFDSTEFHTYSTEWMPGLSRFYIDDELVLESPQAPSYPMQRMLDIFESPIDGEQPDVYPKTFEIDFVKYWSRG